MPPCSGQQRPAAARVHRQAQDPHVGAQARAQARWMVPANRQTCAAITLRSGQSHLARMNVMAVSLGFSHIVFPLSVPAHRLLSSTVRPRGLLYTTVDCFGQWFARKQNKQTKPVGLTGQTCPQYPIPCESTRAPALGRSREYSQGTVGHSTTVCARVLTGYCCLAWLGFVVAVSAQAVATSWSASSIVLPHSPVLASSPVLCGTH